MTGHGAALLVGRPPRQISLDADRIAIVLFVVAATVIGVALFLIVRGFTFYQDEWAFIASRREFSLEALLRPHNEHWQAIPIVVYQVVFAIRGLGSYGSLAAASVGAQLFAGAMLFLLLRRRAHPLLALAGAIGLLCFAWSDEVLLWPVNMSFSLPVGFTFAAIFAWDRDHPRLRWDVLGAVAMSAGLASGGIALVLWIVATAWLAVRSASRARFLWPAASLLVYLAWYLALGAAGLGDTAGFDVALLPSFIAQGLARLAAPMMGLDYRFQLPALIVLSAAIGGVVAWLRHREAAFWIPIGGLLLLFALIGVARLAKYGVDGADAPRYMYPAAALAFLALIPLVDAVRRRCGPNGRRFFWVGVGIWFVVAVAGDVGKLVGSAEHFGERATQIRTELRTVQVLRPALEETTALSQPFDPDLFFGLTPGDYYAAIDDLTPPVTDATVASLVTLSPQERERVDRLIARLLHPGLVPRLASSGPTQLADGLAARVGGVHDVRFATDPSGCLQLSIIGDDPFLSISLEANEQIWMRTDGQRVLQVFARVVGDVYRSPVSSIYPQPTIWYRVTPQPLVPGLFWTLRIDPPPGSAIMDVCLTSEGA